MDEFRLIAGEFPGGSLNGDESIGLTGVESEKGFRPVCGEAGLCGTVSPLEPAPYGGGAVAVDAERATAAAATPPVMTDPMLGG